MAGSGYPAGAALPSEAEAAQAEVAAEAAEFPPLAPVSGASELPGLLSSEVPGTAQALTKA
ncbi:hypothetical protein AOE01nite_19250 [Acetobacter oeni]|uniref:Uncharacterized protein n=1 Tax=Acetobacter oeni TaxID=304077 RepID=A0A511XL78_9PROT|nr:hypothetical protein AA21952_0821 [Acetobacter oeni LMG 21952]GEN63701.1 hypothetical protein AOE01nite_19250 [Acetobacter oeni]